MRIFERNISWNDGKELTIRSLSEQDAMTVLSYLRQSCQETDYMSKYADEVDPAEEPERRLLKMLEEGELTLMLGAFWKEELIATASILPVSVYEKMRHRGGLGISVKESFWGLGIGKLLLGVILEEAAQAGFEQVELEVMEENKRAIRLYEKNGFFAYGRRPYGIKLRDGRYVDELLMQKNLVERQAGKDRM